MNQRERDYIGELTEKLHEMEKKNIKTHFAVEKILSILEDDSNSSRKGVVSEVQQLNKDVEKLMYINSNIRRASIFFLSIVSAVMTMAAKIYFFGDES